MHIISKNLQFQIFKLQEQGLSPYAISTELKIHYRTAKKYVEIFKAMETEMANKFEDAFLNGIIKNENFYINLIQNARGELNGSE